MANLRHSSSVIVIGIVTVFGVRAQQMEDLRALRLKLSAGDLPSAESVLEVHRAEKGEDSEYLMGVAWLARGAALTAEWQAASAYAQRAMDLSQAQLRTPADYETHREATYALGTALEVKAQALVAARKEKQALQFLEENEKAQAQAPFNLRARLWKRWNQIGLEGTKAPTIRAEDWIGAPMAGLEQWRDKPTVLFFWAEWCGDCKAQGRAFRRIVEKYDPRGVRFVAPTRFYTDDRATEKQRVERVWREAYGVPPSVGVPFSDEAMLRYGASATPTFALVDRRGVVRLYSPTRMSEERLSREIDSLLR